MFRHLARLALLLGTLLLGACFGPQTPEEVTKAFWEGVIALDTQAVTRYSTLPEGQGFDGFGKRWSGFQLLLGKQVLDGERAEIDTEFSRLSANPPETRHLVTYLVRQEGTWRVDYARTGEALRAQEKPPEPPSLFGDLGGQVQDSMALLGREVGRLSEDMGKEWERLSADLSQEAQRLSDHLNQESEHLAEALKRFTAELGQSGSQQTEAYAQDLRQRMDELSRSLNQALKERREELSQKNQQALDEALARLEVERQRLKEQGSAALGEIGRNLDQLQQALTELDYQPSLEQYLERWNQWREQLQADMQRERERLQPPPQPQTPPGTAI